jgi:hypothetical protein
MEEPVKQNHTVAPESAPQPHTSYALSTPAAAEHTRGHEAIVALEGQDRSTKHVHIDDPDTSAVASDSEKQQEEAEEDDANSDGKINGRSKGKIAIIMLALCMAVFLAALDVTIITTALPTISEHFQSTAGYTWIGSAFLLANSASIPSWGKISRSMADFTSEQTLINHRRHFRPQTHAVGCQYHFHGRIADCRSVKQHWYAHRRPSNSGYRRWRPHHSGQHRHR